MSAIIWDCQTVAAIVGGRIMGAWPATSAGISGFCIDSRTIKEGQLFVAIRAARDGHGFIKQALAAGAVGALAAHCPPEVAGAPVILVADVQAALNALARAARARTRAKIIAITGSVGKTSTKDMLGAVLARQGGVQGKTKGKTHVAEKSFNNHLGVPLALANMPEDTEFAVFEIGMNGPGEIAPLAKLVRPHIAAITAIAPAHVEAFASLDAIAHEKASIFQGALAGGVAIFNSEGGYDAIFTNAARKANLQIVRFGKHAGENDLFVKAIAQDVSGALCVDYDGRWQGQFSLQPHTGRHFATNALLVFAVAHIIGADIAQARAALLAWKVGKGRGSWHKIYLESEQSGQSDQSEQLRKSGKKALSLAYFDDSYNANPASMRAALKTLAAAAGKRKIAILGDMLELGADAPALHGALAQDAAFADIDRVHTVGPLMETLWHALPAQKRGEKFTHSADLAKNVANYFKAGDVLLIKGSLGIKMAHIVAALTALDRGRANPANK